MRLYALHELLRLSRPELFALYARITQDLAQMQPQSPDRHIATANLRNIGRVLARYEIQLL